MCSRGGYVCKESNTKGFVFLDRDWDGSRLPEDLVEEAGLMGTSFSLVNQEQSARMNGYFRAGGKVRFTLDTSICPQFDALQSKVFLACEFNRWEEAAGQKDWELITSRGEKNILSLEIDWHAGFLSEPFPFKFITARGEWLEPTTPVLRAEKNEVGTKNFVFNQSRSGRDILEFDLVEGPGKKDLEPWIHFLPQGEFGFSETQNESCFRVFAPRAVKVELLLSQLPHESEPVFDRYSMNSNPDGSWEVILPFHCQGSFYKYSVQQIVRHGDSKTYEKELVDPYARALAGRNGPGLAVSVQPPAQKHPFKTPAREDLVILETHVRDLLAKSPISLTEHERMEFRGLTHWLDSDSCYLRKLGVNAIEFQPVQEFDARSKEEYHWGYMTVNFFAPCSAYASNAHNGSAISEFKALVDRLHDLNLAVIVDVVYNHVGIPAHLSFLDRELYFSTDQDGNLSNHSGCGNDIHAESGAVRKLVIDSLLSLVTDFEIDGFRFDLGELLGLDLLREIEKALLGIKPDIILIAEPWSFRGRLPEGISKTKYSLWSDHCREKLMEFARGNAESKEIIDLLRGRLDQQNIHPWQSINYLESHDDFSFIDRLCPPEDWSDGRPPFDVVRQSKMAMGLLLLSPGIPMIASGQDYLRSKQGVQNTYQRGDLNALDYELFKKTEDFHEWTKSLLSFRASNEGALFRLADFLPENQYIASRGENNSFSLILLPGENEPHFQIIAILVNPGKVEIEIPLPDCCVGRKSSLVLGDMGKHLGSVPSICLQVWKFEM